MTLAPADFAFVADLLSSEAAIVLDEGKDYLVESRLAPIARRHDLGTVADLVGELRRRGDSPLRAEVVDAMTTNETSFFRDTHPFQALEHNLLPALMERRRHQRSLNIWCAACSSGQEPYSVAMLIADRFPALRSWNLRIIASDISAEMLGRAAAARYTELEVSRGVPPRLRDRFFARCGSAYRLVDDIREMVEFRALNLASSRWSSLPPVDVVFLRNVLIYFALPTKQEILARVRTVLRPDGYLYLGAPETTMHIDDRFARVRCGQTTVYQPTSKEAA